MITVFSQILILVVFAAIGFFLSKAKIVDNNQTKILSAIGVYVFLPATIFRSFASNFTVDYIKEKYYLILISLGLLLVLAAVFHFVAKLFTKDSYKRAVYHYSLLISNYSYMGYALTGALFGEEMLLNVMIFTMPLTVYIHTVGFCRLTGKKLSLKNIIDPSLIAIFLGAVVGISGIVLPQVVSDIFSKASACMAPVSMLMTGMVISQFGIIKMLKNKNTYIITALRLIVIPAVLAFTLRLFCPEDAVKVAVIVYCLPCGLNTVVFPKLAGQDCEPGASLAVVSNILSLITIPLCINFLL